MLRLFLLILLATGLGAKHLSEQQILKKIPESGKILHDGLKVNVSRANFHDINGHTYYFNIDVNMPWLQAAEFCNILDMALVSLETELEHEAVTNYVYANVTSGSYGMWTSGYYLVDTWFWTGSGQQLTYTNWGSGQPDHYLSYPRVALHLNTGNKLWYDYLIDVKYKIACE